MQHLPKKISKPLYLLLCEQTSYGLYISAPSPSQPTQDLLFVEEDVPPVRPAKPARPQVHHNKKRRNSTPGYRGLKCDLPDNFLRVNLLCIFNVSQLI